MNLSPGTRLRARGLTWDVLAAEPCGSETRLRLRCAAGDLAGLEWDLLHPWETVEALHAELRPECPASPLAWRLRHVAHLLDREPGAGALLAAHTGRVAAEPYQLVPVLRALGMPRPRLLLADGVGLGKTIQAGMIAAELILRRRAHRIIVVTPPGPLLAQWARELLVRFGLRPTILADAAALRARRRALELGGNPFDATALCLTSLDFAKQEPVLAELERSAWDLAIIDEAHHCAGPSTTHPGTASRRVGPSVTPTASSSAGPGGTDTRRHRLAQVLARRSEGLLLLTATPHDGHDAHFASLMALLDPGLVDGQGRLLGNGYRRHVVRRLKAHVRDPLTRQPLFRQRIVTPIPIRLEPDADARVLGFHQALAALLAPRLTRSGRTRHPAEALAFVGLLKRSVSTLRACVNTLGVVAERHAALGRPVTRDEADAPSADPPLGASRAGNPDITAAIRRERTRALRTYRRRLARYGVLSAEQEREQAELEALGMAAALHLHADDDIAGALRALIALGQAAAADDPKLRALSREIHAIRAADPAANVLVYTEYADSLDAAVAHLRADPAIGGSVLGISGADPEPRRAEAADHFAARAPVVLVSTDSLAEGLNLQQRCHHLIHLDLPYNPNRLEQRNGRIDRYGQRHNPDIRYPYLVGTFEERLLLRLIAKYEQARRTLDVMPETIGATADPAALAPGLMDGFAEDQASLFPPPASPIRGLDHLGETTGAGVWRALLHEIDRAYADFERMALRHGWLTGLGGASATRIPRDASRTVPGCTPVGFLAAAVTLAGGIVEDAETSGRDPATAAPRPGTELLVVPPPDWHADLCGLPGRDAERGGLRVSADADRLRDAMGREVACPGWAHPLLRRGLERMRLDPAHGPDPRVAVARAPDRTPKEMPVEMPVEMRVEMRVGTRAGSPAGIQVDAPSGDPPSVLLTYTLERRTARRVALREVIAVHVPRDGPARVIADPAEWLALAQPLAGASDDIWPRLFAPWVPARQAEALALATRAGAAINADFVAEHGPMMERESRILAGWLDRRTEALAGPWTPPLPDLFGRVADQPAWRTLPAPLDRLAAFAADPANPADHRQDAAACIARYRERAEALSAQATLLEPTVVPIGMLMLVPPRSMGFPGGSPGGSPGGPPGGSPGGPSGP